MLFTKYLCEDCDNEMIYGEGAFRHPYCNKCDSERLIIIDEFIEED